MSLTTGVYGAAGHSSVDVKDDDGSRAGTVRDDAGRDVKCARQKERFASKLSQDTTSPPHPGRS